MKTKLRTLILLVLLNLAGSVSVQAQTSFSKVYSGSGGLSNGLLAKARQKGFLMAASLPPNTVVAGCDSLGNILWSKATNKSMVWGDFVFSALDSTYYAAAIADTLGLVLKLNAQGGVLWSKSIQIPGYARAVALSIALCSDSGIAVCGNAYASGTGVTNGFASRLDKYGSLSWSKVVTAPDSVTFNGIAQTPDSGFVIAGSWQENTAVLCKLGKNGGVSWCQKYSEASLAKTQGLGVSVMKQSVYVYLFSSLAPVLLKTDLSGNILFSKKYSFSGQGAFNSGLAGFKIEKTLDNRLFLTVSASYVNGALKMDTLGNPNWAFYSPTCGTDLIQLEDGSFLNAADGPVLGLRMSGYDPAYSGTEIGVSKSDSSLTTGWTCPSLTIPNQSPITFNRSSANYSATATGSLQPFSVSMVSGNVSARVGCPDFSGGFDELTDDSGISTFPNPTNNVLYVHFKKQMPGIVKYSIVNLSGVILMEGTTGYAETDPAIDCSALAPALYLLKLSIQGQLVKTAKLIVKP